MHASPTRFDRPSRLHVAGDRYTVHHRRRPTRRAQVQAAIRDSVGGAW